MSTTPRTDNAWRRYNCADLPDPQELAKEMIALETELAAAKAECYLNRTRIASLFWSGVLDKYTGNDVQKLAADYTAELARLRADNIVAHQMACAAGLERDQLRAEVSEARRAWLGDDYGHLPLIEALEKFRSDSDAESDRADVLYQRSCEVEHALRAEVERLKGALALGQENCDAIYNDMRDERTELTARAEKAEAALAEWSVLNLWGGTPEIIHEFIKGQQNRIHHCQDLEAECLEQARLLGMSGEREADLLGKLERLSKDKARLDWLEEKMWFVCANVMLHDEVPPYTVKTCDGIVHGATVRAAIDAAMKP